MLFREPLHHLQSLVVNLQVKRKQRLPGPPVNSVLNVFNKCLKRENRLGISHRKRQEIQWGNATVSGSVPLDFIYKLAVSEQGLSSSLPSECVVAKIHYSMLALTTTHGY